MWPASKVCPKELFPLGKVPVLMHVIWELVDAGIDHIVVIVGEHSERLIKDLLDPSLKAPPKLADDPVVRRFIETIESVRFDYVLQNGPYGNGTPLINAKTLVGDAPCIYAFADDIIVGENASAGLINMYSKTGYPALCCQPVAEDRKQNFGIVECSDQAGIKYIQRIAEKPLPGTIKSNLASIGRYLVTPGLLNCLTETPIGLRGELWIADSVGLYLSRGEPVCAVALSKGVWHTVGDPAGFAAAVNAIRSQ